MNPTGNKAKYFIINVPHDLAFIRGANINLCINHVEFCPEMWQWQWQYLIEHLQIELHLTVTPL